MNTGTRLGLYGGGLAVLFAAAFGTAAAVMPDDAADDWNDQAEDGGHGGHGSGDGEAAPVRGVSIEQDGYLLSQVSAPTGIGEAGELAFQITGADGEPVTDYTVSHEKELHLIVVRTDGTHFRHVHPELGADGTWSLPWTWDAAGSYRVYADFVPEGGEDLTLTRTVEVAGDYGPEIATEPALVSEVDGFTVTLEGDLSAGASSEVTVSVAREGRPVTELEPYLGAFGHLVALREGDLAYLHVHPEGEAPQAGDLSGPDVTFATEVPTDGRYFLYFDFQVAGQVHSAAFVVDTTESANGGAEADPSEGTTEAPAEEPSESGEHGTDDHGH
ncbi:heavy-metal-associated domain-containing protein [Glycomyces sp. NPDC021274]|uniref:heavy-metal-associated domain-containing protein n=1 Tax=Glycomyces sp. NPDC021274 TaxID=3155120 RepID=UPI0033D414BB